MNWGFKNKTSFLRRIVLLFIGLLAFQTSAVGGSAGGFTGGYILSGGDLEFALESGWNGLKSGSITGFGVGTVSGYGYARQQGINPWTGEVGRSKSFFSGTKYTNKVLGQIEKGDFHAFPESVKAFEKSGVISTIKGGDGVTRQMLKIPGQYRGKNGFFEFIKEADGSINHRSFRPIK